MERSSIKETLSIGTEGTRAAIIETLFKRGFIVRKGKQIISTPSGRAVVAALPAEMTDPVTTAKWEESLSEIAAGKASAGKFDTNIVQFVREQVQYASASINVLPAESKGEGGKRSGYRTAQCPVCGRQARCLKSKKKGSFYWACENRDHKLMSDNNGKPGTEFQQRTLTRCATSPAVQGGEG